jgi:cysteine desulfurase
MIPVYLDNNATTRLHPEARRAMQPFLDDEYGNPSSVHAAGRRAREAVERARDEVATLVGGTRDEIVFTSGGTEGNNLALRGAAELVRAGDARRTRILAPAVEHPSVEGALGWLGRRGFQIERLPVDATGCVAVANVEERLGDDVALVTLHLANHELGVIQPVAEVAARARAAGAWVHTDAVQAAGKVPVDVRALGVDSATVSAHKLYGPKGVGAVWLRAGRAIGPHTAGGHQERERRPGTENVAGIVGFGAAAAIATRELEVWARSESAMRDRLEAGALALGARVNGGGALRVPNTSNLAWPGVEGELLVEALDLEGVAVSTGAACTSGSHEPSPVVLALGQSRAQAAEAVRFSLSRETVADEIDRVLALLPTLIARIRAA